MRGDLWPYTTSGAFAGMSGRPAIQQARASEARRSCENVMRSPSLLTKATRFGTRSAWASTALTKALAITVKSPYSAFSTKNQTAAKLPPSPNRRFWPARRREAMRTGVTLASRERSASGSATYQNAGSHAQGARSRCVLEYMRLRGTRRVRFRHPLKVGSDAQGAQGRRVLEYSRSCGTQRIRFHDIRCRGNGRLWRDAQYSPFDTPPGCP